MGPVANLNRQREIAAILLDKGAWGAVGVEDKDAERKAMSELATELAELVQALDVWRRSGGLDPYHISERLEHLRGEIRAERVSYGEIAELEGLAEHIEPGDTELLQWANVPEFPEGD